jgi:hypothetical protein
LLPAFVSTSLLILESLNPNAPPREEVPFM